MRRIFEGVLGRDLNAAALGGFGFESSGMMEF